MTTVQPLCAFDDLERRLEACRLVTLESIALQVETRFLAARLVTAANALLAVTYHASAALAGRPLST